MTSRALLFRGGNYQLGGGHAEYDVAPDGRSFVLLRPVEGRAEEIVVIHNWAAELRASAKSAKP